MDTSEDRLRQRQVMLVVVVAREERRTSSQWWLTCTDSGCNPFVACTSAFAAATAPRTACTAAVDPILVPIPPTRTAASSVAPLKADMMASTGTAAEVRAVAVDQRSGCGRTATGTSVAGWLSRQTVN